MEEPKKAPANYKVIGINVAIFAVYTLGCKLIYDDIFNAIPVYAIHVLACFVLAIIYRQLVWVLSGMLLLLIGFSTCVAIFTLG
ncbi:hypothetical protein [Mucilaginibacter pedocola]|uniref:Uncharacterized protein n=1 Tax=Mucilaginibacter pedocola TaxID=1792845 RepID=A0A1S9PJF9_9SPHI|nr:hypothetical protein [Mucilaginibacter pedocola]OOQ61059.1 hypothetical protein BC343_21665 [Mucilaginibacter pedocola]